MMNYVLRNSRRFLYQFTRLLPKSARRPFYSLAMTIGAYLFLLFMMKVTKSTYLIQLNTAIVSFFMNLLKECGKEMFVFMIIGGFVLFSYFVYRKYEIFTAFLFFLYLAILIAGLLPWLLS